MNDERLSQIKDYLRKSGLNYEQLETELIDHLLCDIERRMEHGQPYEEAWSHVKDSIPNNELVTIQNETMEILNKKLSLTRLMSLISLFLFIQAAVFKILHLQGAAFLLIAAIVSFTMIIFLGVIRDFSVNKQKDGKWIVATVAALIIAFIMSIVFQLLHLPGTFQLRLVSILLLIVLFPAISIYYFKRGPLAANNRLVTLVENSGKAIEWGVAILVAMGVLFKMYDIFLNETGDGFVGIIFLIYAIIIAGSFCFSLTWQVFVNSTIRTKRNVILLVTSILAFVLFMVPAISNIALPRMMMASIAGIIFSAIVFYHYAYHTKQPNKTLAALCLVVIAIITIKTSLEQGMWSDNRTLMVTDFLYNPWILFGLMALPIVFFKHRLFRLFMLLMIAYYLFNYAIPTA